MVHRGTSPFVQKKEQVTTNAKYACHGTGDAGETIPAPSFTKSLFLSYPKAFLCTTFLYKEPVYALRNAIFMIGSAIKAASFVLLPVLIVAYGGTITTTAPWYWTNQGLLQDTYPFVLLLTMSMAAFTILSVVVARYKEFAKYDHIPGPKPAFLYGNLKDLCRNEWGYRHRTLVDLHEEYGAVFCLHMPLLKRPFVYCNFVPDTIYDKKFDSLRPTKTLTPGSLMGIPLGGRHLHNRHHLSKMKSNKNFRMMLADVGVVSKDIVFLMRQNESGNLESLLLEWSLDAMFLYLYGTHPATSNDKKKIIAAVDMFTSEISLRTNEPMWMWFASWKRILTGIPLGGRHSHNRHHLSKMKSNKNFRMMLADVGVVSKDIVFLMRQNESGNLESLLLEWSLDAMFLYLYGTHPATSNDKKKIIAAVDMFTSEISLRTNEPMWMWFASWKRIKRWTTGFSYLLDLADEYYSEPSCPLPSFMKSQGLAKWEALDELTIFLAASFESTAHTVAQCLIMLSDDESCQQKAAKEAREILAEAGDGPVLKDHVDKAMFIQHCVFEALRLHPTIPFSARKMTKEYSIKQLDGKSYSIPGNSYLVYFKTAIGLNESIFPDADKFKPERYEGMKTRTEKHMKFLPFGTGPRQCWGQLIAEMQMTQLLIHLLGGLQFESTKYQEKQEDDYIPSSIIKQLRRRMSVAAVSVAAPGVASVKFTVRK